MSRKQDYNAGVVTGLKINEKIMSKQAEALDYLRQKANELGVNQDEMRDIFLKIVDDMDQNAVATLFGVVNPVLPETLDDHEKQILLNILTLLAVDINDAQKQYFNNLRRHLNVIGFVPDNNFDFRVVENIEKTASIKIIVKCIREFLFLKDNSEENFAMYYENIFSHFEINERSINEIDSKIATIYYIFGEDGIVEMYGTWGENTEDVEPEMDETAMFQRYMLINEIDMNIGSNCCEILRKNLFENGFDGEENPYTLEKVDDISDSLQNSKRYSQIAVLLDNVNKSIRMKCDVCCGEAFAYRNARIDDNGDDDDYFFIFTMDTLFVFVDEKVALIEYSDLEEVSEDDWKLTIKGRIKWYEKNGRQQPQTSSVDIVKEDGKEELCSVLRLAIEQLQRGLGWVVEDEETKVENIIKEYIYEIPSDGYRSYFYKDFDENSVKKLRNSLKRYAMKMRESEVIGFVDISVFGNGGDGIVFSREGMAFKSLFEKVYIRYDEIDRMSIEKNFLYIFGSFSERAKDDGYVELIETGIKLKKVKECLEKIIFEVNSNLF